jgi:hypothetical protein
MFLYALFLWFPIQALARLRTTNFRLSAEVERLVRRRLVGQK